MKVNNSKIRFLREEKGYTLTELAKEAGMSFSYLSEIERGSKQPSLKTLEKLSQALQIPREEIIDLQDGNVKVSFGDKVRLAREKKGLTGIAFAAQIGLSPSYVSEMERNSVMPSVSTIRKIAEVLEIPIPVLLNNGSTLGIKLKASREERGLTQQKLAQDAGVSAGLIAQVEGGKIQPSFKTIEKISKVLGVSPCYFVLDNESVDDMLPAFSPELRELLQEENVQGILRMVCHMNKRELQYIFNMIKLYKESKVGL